MDKAEKAAKIQMIFDILQNAVHEGSTDTLEEILESDITLGAKCKILSKVKSFAFRAHDVNYLIKIWMLEYELLSDISDCIMLCDPSSIWSPDYNGGWPD